MTSPYDTAYLAGYADGSDVTNEYVSRVELDLRNTRAILLVSLLINVILIARKVRSVYAIR